MQRNTIGRDRVVANRQLVDKTIAVFRANDLQGRTVLLVLSGAAAVARDEEKKAPQPLPLTLTLKLSYILDAALPKANSERALCITRPQPLLRTLQIGIARAHAALS